MPMERKMSLVPRSKFNEVEVIRLSKARMWCFGLAALHCARFQSMLEAIRMMLMLFEAKEYLSELSKHF
jgi:hypothetical protein